MLISLPPLFLDGSGKEAFFGEKVGCVLSRAETSAPGKLKHARGGEAGGLEMGKFHRVHQPEGQRTVQGHTQAAGRPSEGPRCPESHTTALYTLPVAALTRLLRD